MNCLKTLEMKQKHSKIKDILRKGNIRETGVLFSFLLRCPERWRFQIQPAGDLKSQRFEIIDLLMGLFRGAVFHHGGVPENSPLTLMGRFPSLMGRFPTLMGRFPECLNGPFPSRKSPGKQPIKKRGIKRFLNLQVIRLRFCGSLCVSTNCGKCLSTC